MKNDDSVVLNLSFSNSNAKIDEYLIKVLEGVETYGSISSAANHVSISTSNAFSRIRNVEKQCGQKLVMLQGDHTIDGSCLTEAGKKLVVDYRALTSSIKKDSAELVENYLK